VKREEERRRRRRGGSDISEQASGYEGHTVRKGRGGRESEE